MAIVKLDRIDLRVSPDDKKTLEMAAAAKRLSLSSYIIQAAMENAASDLERERTINVSKEGWNRLMALIENPPEPTEALKRIFQ